MLSNDQNIEPIICPGMTLYHGTSAESMESILSDGIDMGKSCLGYFGEGFYCATEKDLAISNYAEMSDGEPALIQLEIDASARILDLRNAEDYEVWQKFSKNTMMGRVGFSQLCCDAGIDGLYDNSFGGVVIYNPKVLINISGVKLEARKKPSI